MKRKFSNSRPTNLGCGCKVRIPHVALAVRQCERVEYVQANAQGPRRLGSGDITGLKCLANIRDVR